MSDKIKFNWMNWPRPGSSEKIMRKNNLIDLFNWIGPGAQKKIIVRPMRIGIYFLSNCGPPLQGAKSGPFQGSFWAPFRVHFWLPLRGSILGKTQGKQRFSELSCTPKRLGFGTLSGFISGLISGSISGRLPWGRFSQAQPEKMIFFSSIELDWVGSAAQGSEKNNSPFLFNWMNWFRPDPAGSRKK